MLFRFGVLKWVLKWYTWFLKLSLKNPGWNRGISEKHGCENWSPRKKAHMRPLTFFPLMICSVAHSVHNFLPGNGKTVAHLPSHFLRPFRSNSTRIQFFYSWKKQNEQKISYRNPLGNCIDLCASCLFFSGSQTWINSALFLVCGQTNLSAF